MTQPFLCINHIHVVYAGGRAVQEAVAEKHN